MGSIERGISPLGERSRVLNPHPAVAGLPRFEARFSRRSFNLGAAAAGTLAAVGIPLRAQAQVESPVDIAQDQEQLLSDAVTRWGTAAVKEEALGELFELTGMPLSWGFYDQVGYSKLFQSMLVSLDQDNNPVLRNLLTEEELNGFDTYNIPPFLGDAAPKKGVSRIPPPRVSQITAALSRVFGLPNLQITGLDSFAGYNSYRIGDETGDKLGLIEYTQGEEKGTIRMAHFASLAVQAGIVPQDMMLAYGELATGGGTTPTPQETAQLRLFEPEYRVTWPDGKSFTVINPKEGNKGLVFQDQEVWMIKRVPITLMAVRDSEGKPVFEDKPSTTKVELGKLMDRYGVSKILIVPNKEKATRPTPFGQKNTPWDNEPFMFSDWYAKPEEYPDADLVMFYWFAETERQPEGDRLDIAGMVINGDIGFILPIFKNRTPGEVIKDYAYNTPEQGALGTDLVNRIKPVRYALETA